VSPASPLVSVLVSAHDAEAFLRPALDSVLRQTLRDLELIVVDDESTDATAEILASIDDPRLVLLRNDERLGLAASLNRALDHARGRYVARLDADDIAFPRRLERQLARMQDGSSPAILGSAVMELDGNGGAGELHVMPRGSDAVRWAALFSSPFFHPSVVIDRELLEREGLRYDTKFLESEDYDLWARLLRVAEGDNLAEPLVLYRVHEGQASTRRHEVQREFQLRVALREIARVAPELTPQRAELAWRVGVGEAVEPDGVEDAVSAFVELAHSFESTSGRRARSAAARALASFARSASASRPQILSEALKLDPTLVLHATSRRAKRVAAERAARREAEGWLAELELGARARALRVAAVFPEPTPYRAPLLDRVAELPEVELTVIYAAETVAGRTWQVEPRHTAVYLGGLNVPGARRVLQHEYPITPGITGALGRSRPDVVVVSGWSTFTAQAAIAWCRLRRVPYVLVVESHDEGPRAGWRRAIKRTVVPPLVRASSGSLVTGTLARRSMIARGAAPERVHVFANTIDVQAFGEGADRLVGRRPELREELGASPDDVVVLSVGRLAVEKGMDVLVRAIAGAGDPRLLLVLAGGGPERARLEELAQSLGARLVLVGDRPWERIAEIYVAADVFALVSTREPWGVVVNEAAACGLPLVLSDSVGAAHDLLRDGENGFLVPTGDVAAAAGAIKRLALDPSLRRSFAERSREVASQWGYGPSVEGFLAAVQEAYAARPRI
jgi:glycosyltransferase involved in cell wall biosynthesis/GT2 family glycosyltransferase